jgi:hypothetical protein
MPKRSPETLLKLFESNEVLEFKDLQAALGYASRATTFRYLKQIPYHRSYNYNGRYYTRQDLTRYDRFGLFCWKDILFSRDRTLGETVRRLVGESAAGWTQRELQEVLRVRLGVVLLEAFEKGELARETVNGFYVYLDIDPLVRQAQLSQRQEQIAAVERAMTARELEVSDAVAIAILLTLLRHPAATAAEVVRRLRGHCPAITLAQVRVIFARYELEHIDQKGGVWNC